jgi:hypothetical protein
MVSRICPSRMIEVSAQEHDTSHERVTIQAGSQADRIAA